MKDGLIAYIGIYGIAFIVTGSSSVAYHRLFEGYIDKLSLIVLIIGLLFFLIRLCYPWSKEDKNE